MVVVPGRIKVTLGGGQGIGATLGPECRHPTLPVVYQGSKSGLESFDVGVVAFGSGFNARLVGQPGELSPGFTILPDQSQDILRQDALFAFIEALESRLA